MTAKASKCEAEQGYTKTDLEDVSDTPEFTADEMARAKPFAAAFSWTRDGREPRARGKRLQRSS